MNRWTSKKPLWPFLVALGCLFVLAVAAPSSWNRDSSPSQPLFERVVEAEPIGIESVQALAIPEYGTWEPEYDVAESVDVALLETVELSLLPINLKIPSLASDLTPAVPPIGELPVQQKFDLSVLLRMRDVVLAVVDRLPKQECMPNEGRMPTLAAPRRRVLVDSEHDRLAMLDIGNRHGREEQRFAMRPAAPAQPSIELPPPVPTFPPLIRHRPNVLYERLETLVDVPLASTWSERVVAQLRQLTEETPTQETDGSTILQELRSLAEDGNDLALKLSHPEAQQDWLQATQALERRLEIWQELLAPKQQERTSTDLSESLSSLLSSLGEVTALLATESNGSAWREYLLLDRIAVASSEGVGIDTEGLSKLAYEVLSRMSDRRLTEAQATFLATPPLFSLRQMLQPWAAQSIDLNRLLALVERYETGRELRYAAAIARVQQQLLWSDNARYRALGEHLDQHYRSSNMRIAFSADLLNRMMPKQKTTVMPVRERIAGAKVRGQARTTTKLKVRLLPDPNSWQFSLEASGKVTSNTQSETWPARVRNAAKMEYLAKKVIVINQQGLRASPAQATAQGRHDLIGVDSQLDSVPLFGYLLREIARKKNHKSRPSAMSQVKSKVVQQARQRMDQEADPKLSNLEQKFRDNVLGPLGQLALIAEPVALVTTSERAVMQLRLANAGQLGAHTPRPLAPSDSVVSMQLHETVLNNALAGLGLDGRRMKLPELYHFFAEKFGDANAALPEDLPTRAVIEFAARDAILINCEGDRLNLVLSIREMAHGRDKIKNFQVHAYFRPVLDGLAVRLVRDGSLQFSARRLKTGPRIVLHSALGKLLPKDQEVRLIAGELRDDPRLAGLMVTQLVIDDGWIGLALGPASADRNAWRSPSSGSLASFMR